MQKQVVCPCLAAFSAILLGGCLSVGPDYEKPATPMPDTGTGARRS
jgi:hypothetical protein